MIKYILTQVVNEEEKLTYEFGDVDLPGMLVKFRFFLQGCSFVIDPVDEIIIDQSRKYEEIFSRGKKVKK